MQDDSYAALCSAITLQSNKKGFFQRVTDGILESVGEEWICNFGTLKTNEQRIAKCLNDEKIKDRVYHLMDNVQEIFRGKSASVSWQRRQEAENFYKNGKMDKALLMYTQSVIRAPAAGKNEEWDEGLSLALALFERSKILYQQKKPQFCLDDVKLSLKEKLPETLRLEAYWRMAECYINLKMFDQARITLNILTQITRQNETDNIPVEWNSKIQTKLNELIDHVSKIKKDGSHNGTKDHVPNLSGDTHANFKNISSKLKLTKTKKAGKFFIAGEQIQTGDTLVVEEPYVSCLSSEKSGSHCHHCLRRLETAIPCPDCSGVAFCSLACRTTALKTYHKFECHYMDLLIGSGMSVLCFAALRIVSQQSVKYFLDAALDSEDEYDHPYRQVYNMMNHADKREPEDFLRRTLMALFLLAVLKKSGFFASSTNVQDIRLEELQIGRALLRNLEVLQFNAHEISEPIVPKDTTKPIQIPSIGIGLYKAASHFNHECFIAVSRYFIGTKLIVKAVRPISKNEIVGENYGPVFTKFSREDRQKKLEARYWFKCECKACLQNWPTTPQTDFSCLRLRCLHCGVPVKVGETKRVTCSKCRKLTNFEETMVKINELKQRLLIPPEQLEEREVDVLCAILDSLDKALRPDLTIYGEIFQKLSQFWMRRQAAQTR